MSITDLDKNFQAKLKELNNKAQFVLHQFRLAEFESFYNFFIVEQKTIDFSKLKNCGYKAGKELNNLISYIINLSNSSDTVNNSLNDSNIQNDNFTRKVELKFDKKFDELSNRTKNVLHDFKADNFYDFKQKILCKENFDFRIRNCGAKTQSEIIEFKKYILSIVQEGSNEEKQNSFFKDLEIYLLEGRVLKSTELKIMLFYYSFINENENKSLENIAKEAHLTKERVRQLSIITLDKIKSVAQKLYLKGNYDVENYFQNDYFVVNERFTALLNQSEKTNFSSAFLTHILQLVSPKNFAFISVNEKRQQYSGLFIKNSIPFDFRKFYDYFQQFIDVRKKEDVILNIEELIKQFIIPKSNTLFSKPDNLNLLERMQVLEGLKLIIENLLDNYNEMELTSESIIIKRNTKRLKHEYIVDILNEYKKPMHFTELYEECLKRQVKASSALSIHGLLQHYPEIFGLKGQGMYGLKEWGGRFGTIGDVAEEIIKEKNQPIDRKDLLNILCRELYVSQDSVNTVLFFYEPEKRFIKMKNGKVGLREWLNKSNENN